LDKETRDNTNYNYKLIVACIANDKYYLHPYIIHPKEFTVSKPKKNGIHVAGGILENNGTEKNL